MSAAAAASGSSLLSLPEADQALAAAVAAQTQRAALIKAELTKHRATKARINQKYKAKGRGRRLKADQLAYQNADASIKFLEAGEFPHEAKERIRLERVAAHKARQAEQRAAGPVGNAAHHAAAPDGRSADGAAASSGGGGGGGGGGAQEQGPDDEENDALPDNVDKTYFNASSAQRAFNDEALSTARCLKGGHHHGSGFFIYQPKHFAQLGGCSSTVAVDRLIVFDPNRAFGCGHGACPVHGWDRRAHIVTAGFTRPRRISGVYGDEWGCCRWLRCKLCQEEREEVKEELTDLEHNTVLLPSAKATKRAKLLQEIKESQFWYRQYDPRVMAIFAERTPFITANPYFIVSNCHAALTVELAVLVKRYCIGGNPTDLARMLAELHQERFFRQVQEYYQWHYFAKKQTGQLTIRAMEAKAKKAVVVITLRSRNVASAGHALLRVFFLTVQKKGEMHQFLVRQNHIDLSFISSDHSLKVFGKLRGVGLPLLTARLTFWDNKNNVPPFGLNTGTTSYDDPAVVRG